MPRVEGEHVGRRVVGGHQPPVVDTAHEGRAVGHAERGRLALEGLALGAVADDQEASVRDLAREQRRRVEERRHPLPRPQPLNRHDQRVALGETVTLANLPAAVLGLELLDVDAVRHDRARHAGRRWIVTLDDVAHER